MSTPSSLIIDLPGKAALSVFRFEKLRQDMPMIVYAEYVHLLAVEGAGLSAPTSQKYPRWQLPRSSPPMQNLPWLQRVH